MRTSATSNVLPSTEFGYPSGDGNQIRLLGAAPNTPLKQEGVLRMSELLFFIIGTMLGSLVGVVLMCLLQINKLSKREEVENAKTKCADTFPLE